jgi:hypothetical protein
MLLSDPRLQRFFVPSQLPPKLLTCSTTGQTMVSLATIFSSIAAADTALMGSCTNPGLDKPCHYTTKKKKSLLPKPAPPVQKLTRQKIPETGSRTSATAGEKGQNRLRSRRI